MQEELPRLLTQQQALLSYMLAAGMDLLGTTIVVHALHAEEMHPDIRLSIRPGVRVVAAPRDLAAAITVQDPAASTLTIRPEILAMVALHVCRQIGIRGRSLQDELARALPAEMAE